MVTSQTFAEPIIEPDLPIIDTHRNLHIIADGNTGMRCHRAAVGVGERDLALPRLVQLRQHAGSHTTCMGLFLSSGCFGFAVSSLFGAGRPFFVPSPAIRFPERAEGVKGPKR